MPRKRHKPEEIVAKLRQIDVLTSQGHSVPDAIPLDRRERRRQEYGGLKSDQVKRLKDLETEDGRLRRAISDLTLDKLILEEAAKGKTSKPRAGGGLPVAVRDPRQAVSMACRTAGPLWLDKLSMITMSPGRSSGTSTCST